VKTAPRQTRDLRRRAAEAVAERRERRRARPRRFGLWRYFAVIGPGIIVANAGNDAGGVFTYSNTGAKYGYNLLWAFLPIAVALIITQEMVARLGTVTGKGLMDLIRERFGVRWTLFAAVVVLIANGGTTLAEFAGVAGGLGLLGVPLPVAVIGAAALIGAVVMRGNRRLVERIFLALGLTFVSYIVTAFLVPHPDWTSIGRDFVLPNFGHPSSVRTGAYLIDVIALIGTSITPYMQLFLQSSIVDKGTREEDLRLVRVDVISGSIFAVIVAAFIVITTAATLFPPSLEYPHGLAGNGVASAQQAASALSPLVGVHAQQLFAVGLVGASLLAAAVLPLSTAFVICEAFGAERSVQSSFADAPLFFTLFIGILAIGAGIMLIPGVPIAGVAIGTQTLDGILLPIMLVFIIVLANDRRLLGARCNGVVYNVIAVSLATVLTVLTATLVITTLFPSLIGD
jgi:NRAMP (natural resistance-associated macrophage protein)-like metal ion transporter